MHWNSRVLVGALVVAAFVGVHPLRAAALDLWAPGILAGPGHANASSAVHGAVADTTPPSTVGMVNGSPVADGGTAPWVGAAVLTVDASDDLSGVATTLVSQDNRPWVTYSGPITVGGAGYKNFRFYSVDTAGNVEATRTLTVRIDVAPPATPAYVNDTRVWDGVTSVWNWIRQPAVLTLAPVDGWYWSNWDGGSGTRETRLSFDGEHWQTYAGPVEVPGEGSMLVQFYSVDFAGNVEPTRTAMVRIDRTPPTTSARVLATDVPDGGTAPWTGDWTPLTLTPSDALSGVGQTLYSVDGSPWQVYTDYTPIMAAGIVPIRYYSVDKAGNVEPIRTLTARIDLTGPDTSATVDGEGVADGGTAPWANASGGRLAFTARDSESGVAAIYYFDGGNWQTYAGTPVVFGEGIRTIRYHSVDVVGAQGPPGSVTLRIDATAPTTSADVSPAYVDTATIAIASSDELSGVSRTEYELDGRVAVGTLVATSEPGTHILRHRAVDVAGNTGAWSPAETFAVVSSADCVITASAGAGGTIAPSGVTVVSRGSDATFNITPKSGYHVADVLVDGSSVGAVTSYRFTGITVNHAISATFAVDSITPTSITIKSAATVTTIGKTVALSGAVTPTGMIGANIVVYVMKPDRPYWSYSSNRTVYGLGGSPAWLYKYYFKPGMARGYYRFKAVAPAPGFPSSAGFATSTSPTTVTIRVR